MRYDILKKSEPHEGGPNTGIEPGTPLELRIIPEKTEVRQLFIAIVQSAYEMYGSDFSFLNEPKTLTEKEAAKYILYEKERSLTDRILGRPDTRMPMGVSSSIRGRPVKLYINSSKEVTGSYEMNAYVFERDVGSVEILFELVKNKLPNE
jgi:hypothetical protein